MITSPYDIIGVTSFVQGCLTLVAAIVAALWSITQQAQANRLLVATIAAKITHLREQYDTSTLVNSGTTNRLLGGLQEEHEKLAPVSSATLLNQWLNQSQIALELAKISNRVDALSLEFHLVDIRNQIIQEIRKKSYVHHETSRPQGRDSNTT